MYKRNYETTVTPKARRVLERAIELNSIDITRSFNLYFITAHVETCLTSRERESCRLETTGDVLRALDVLRKEHLC